VPRATARRLAIDFAEPGMGVRAAHEGCVQHARDLNVVDKAALPGQQGGVFQAGDPRAKVLCAHAS